MPPGAALTPAVSEAAAAANDAARAAALVVARAAASEGAAAAAAAAAAVSGDASQSESRLGVGRDRRAYLEPGEPLPTGLAPGGDAFEALASYLGVRPERLRVVGDGDEADSGAYLELGVGSGDVGAGEPTSAEAVQRLFYLPDLRAASRSSRRSVAILWGRRRLGAARRAAAPAAGVAAQQQRQYTAGVAALATGGTGTDLDGWVAS